MKASVFVGTSVDGFIARANSDLDWLPPSGGEEHGYDAFIATVDANPRRQPTGRRGASLRSGFIVDERAKEA